MKLNRRNFIFGSTAAAALAGCSTQKVGLRELKPGEKRRLAMIGYGIQMRTALIPQFLNQTFAKNVEIVAVCDCDRVRAVAGAKQVNDAYKKNVCEAVIDFRDVLSDPTIDAVCIATPDHWHAYMCVEAMKHGKDVYCEKPLTFSPEESAKVIAAQKKYGRVFQTGSMQRSWKEFRTATMIVRNGLIGDVMYVDANYGRSGQKLGGPSHPIRFFDDPNNAAKESAPNADVDWDMWLGPARWRPYSDQLAPRGVNKFYPMFWRFDDDIGTGYNGDWGAHHLDIAQWGLDMDESGPVKAICSDEPHSTNLYHGGRRQYGMKMIFKKPYGDVELYHGPFGVWGTVFYGTDGIVAVNRGKIAVWKGTGPHVGHGHIALADMNTVRPDFGGNGRVVVHDEHGLRPLRDPTKCRPNRDNLGTRRFLHPQLNHPNASTNRHLAAAFVADDRIGHHEIKAEVLHRAFKSCATICAILRPLFSMPPKIGPMRKPPCTLLAAIPDA